MRTDKTENEKWRVKYTDGIGACDDGVERWHVTDGTRFFECYDADDANWLCFALNKLGALIQDKNRLDWLDHAKSAEYCEGPMGWSINGWSGPYGDTIRDAIDAAMPKDETV